MADMNPQYPIIDNSSDTSLREVVGPLFRRKKALVITFLVVTALIILLGALMPLPYKSSMAVLINRERVDPLVTTESTVQMPSTATAAVTLEEINSEAELLLSQDILTKVVLATGLDRPSTSWLSHVLPARNEDQRVAHAVKALAKKIQVKNQTNSNLIEVSYTSSNPQESFAVLNALGRFYVEKHVQVHRPPGSYEFFSKETDEYRGAMNEAETKLRNFSTQENVAAPDVVRTYLAQTLATSIGQLNTIKQAIAGDTDRIRNDEAQLKKTPQRLPTVQATAPADKLLDALNTALLTAQAKRTQLVSKYNSNYPLVQEADQEIAQTKIAIAGAEQTKYVSQSTDVDPTYELLREDLEKTQADLASQRAAGAAASQGIQNLRAQMVDLDQNALTQQDLQRDAKVNQDNYLLYLGKREQERTSDALDQEKIGNVTIAVPPAIPVLPVYSMPIVILVALALGFFLSIGVAYTVDYFDTSFHSPAQVVETLGIPVVITISKKTA